MYFGMIVVSICVLRNFCSNIWIFVFGRFSRIKFMDYCPLTRQGRFYKINTIASYVVVSSRAGPEAEPIQNQMINRGYRALL